MSERGTTSRFKPLSLEERAVCRRVAEARRMQGLSKAALCERVRITHDQLANIESGRVSLKWSVGDRICRALNLSQLWVAAGEEPMQPFFQGPVTDKLLFEDAPFSVICLGKLRSEFESHRAMIAKEGDAVALGKSEDAIVQAITGTVRTLLLHVEWKNRLPFLERAIAALRAVAFKVEMRNIAADYSGKRKLLTETESGIKLPPVKSQLDNLLTTLSRLTKESGKKTELAEFLGAPLASVSRWLSREREPGGETTLRMLHWVEQQERQLNTLGSAMNTTKGKTQVRKSKVYEKANPSPKKR